MGIRGLFSECGRRFEHTFWMRMDLLEKHLPAEVEAIQAANSDEAAYQMLADLRNAVQECPTLTENEKRQLDLLLIGVTQFSCVEKMPGGHLSGAEESFIPQLKML
jgi:hypothetical protein